MQEGARAFPPPPSNQHKSKKKLTLVSIFKKIFNRFSAVSLLTSRYSNFECKTKTAVEFICQSDSFPLQYNIANIIHKYKVFDNYLPTLSSIYLNSFNSYLTRHSKLKSLQKTDMVSITAALRGSTAVVK